MTMLDGQPLPIRLVTQLNLEFRYMLRTMKPARGRKPEMVITPCYMLQSINEYRMVTTYGMAGALKRWLTSKGVPLAFSDTTPDENNSLLLKPDWSVLSKYTLRNRQDDCLKAIVSRRHGIINAPVGFGKTFLMGVLTQLYPTAKFHIVTKAVAIANRIYDDLKRVSDDVGMVGGGKNIPEKRIVVYTADSLKKSDGEADFLIWDECHQAAATTYASAVTRLYKWSRNYGFTATPKGRSDGADPLLQMLFGDTIFEMDYQEAQDKGLVVPIHVRWLVNDHCPPGASNKQTRVALERHCIWRNEARNRLIADDIHSHYGEDDQVLVLVDRVEHGMYLSKFLPEFTLVYGSVSDEDMARYKTLGVLPEGFKSLKAKDKESLKESFKEGKLKKVIATFWHTGVDFPALEAVYNISAGASPILTTQKGGRGSRTFVGKEFATVVDVVDMLPDAAAVFTTSARRRASQYKSLGWEQEGFPNNGKRRK